VQADLAQARPDTAQAQAGARLLAERLALALQAAALLRADSPAAGPFLRSRLVPGAHGLALGTLPETIGFKALIERALPPDRPWRSGSPTTAPLSLRMQ
jgi:putative acyl-CoA dehydrogenase